mgnify:CR=1 FL=1
MWGTSVIRLLVVAAVLMIAGSSPPPRVEPQGCDLSGVVQLFVRGTDRGSSGTGFAVDSGILTNAHMFMADAAVTVVPNGRADAAFPSRFLAVDEGTDLALVELPIDLAVTPLAPTAWVPQGTAIRIVGFPGPVQDVASMTQGIVSKVWTNEMGVRILTDAAVNPGSSGSPILGNDCTALGIVHARYESPFGRTIYGMGLGVGAETIRAFLDLVNAEGED